MYYYHTFHYIIILRGLSHYTLSNEFLDYTRNGANQLQIPEISTGKNVRTSTTPQRPLYFIDC